MNAASASAAAFAKRSPSADRHDEGNPDYRSSQKTNGADAPNACHHCLPSEHMGSHCCRVLERVRNHHCGLEASTFLVYSLVNSPVGLLAGLRRLVVA